MAKKSAKKVALDDLLEGKPSKPNADLYKTGKEEDEEKRRMHKKWRAPRSRLFTPKGPGYIRRLSGDPAKDILYHEMAREFINNGFNQGAAYAAVFGEPLNKCRSKASRIFNSSWMRALVLEMLQGSDGEMDEIPKQYALEKWIEQIESNVLDYMDDEGRWLNVSELKALPRFAQQCIKKLNVHSWTEEQEITDDEGEVIRTVEVHHQRVSIELVDKQKALESMAKAMKWIETKGDTHNNIILGADLMMRASERVRKLSREPIDVEAETTKSTASD